MAKLFPYFPIKGFLNPAAACDLLMYSAKWIPLAGVVGVLAGSASAAFLISLEWATNTREANTWLIYLLPLGGLAIAGIYQRWGQLAQRGNNLVIDEYLQPSGIIPWVMAPLVFIGTLITHLFGGSAGREGTAVQMGASLAHQLVRPFKLNLQQQQVLIVCGVSAGFASVFGTPLAGTLFALEVFRVNKVNYQHLFPALVSALMANYVCGAWGATHTHYLVPEVPYFSYGNIAYSLVLGLLAGVAARLFSFSAHWMSAAFNRLKNPFFRPLLGGAVIALYYLLVQDTTFLGLGVPTIEQSFILALPAYFWLIKLLLTTFTLGAGFKGGEVTPLFFIGATMGSAMSLVLPLPVALCAGMGFVAVFAGATHTPLACIFMAVELFGADGLPYYAVACVLAHLVAGRSGIYSAQEMG